MTFEHAWRDMAEDHMSMTGSVDEIQSHCFFPQLLSSCMSLTKKKKSR